ncbi:MAG TPA: AMP-binding protein [Phycisphaerales bacterium]|nr:AMP-binding protein [Phycisphaerales bacterium]
MSVHGPIIRRLALSPLSVSAIDDQRAWRNIELLVAAFHFAALIERSGKTKTVAIMLPTGCGFATAALGAWIAGRVVVPLNYLLKREELQYVIDDCGTDLVLTAPPLLEAIGYEPSAPRLLKVGAETFSGFPEPRWPAAAADNDLAALLYTSGTSGTPKGVMLTHGNIAANVRQCEGADVLRPNDIALGVLPQFHSFGFTVLTWLTLTLGVRVVFSARFVPQRIIRLFREHRPTAFVAIPSMYHALMSVKDAGPDDFKSVRLAVSGGEPLPRAVADRFFDRFNVRINEGYGLTETSPVTHWCSPGEYVPACVGRPLPRVEQRIVDWNTGREMSPNVEGEIRLRGPNIMSGYYHLPKETAAAFDDAGWFRTGDIGKTDALGRLYITGRLKEMIIVGGENVFPREIEEVLERHPSIQASAVIGVSDEMRGELPWAFVEIKPGEAFDESALRQWCRDHLAGYKVPREIRPIEKLPRNPTGKIMRRELKSLATAKA